MKKNKFSPRYYTFTKMKLAFLASMLLTVALVSSIYIMISSILPHNITYSIGWGIFLVTANIIALISLKNFYKEKIQKAMVKSLKKEYDDWENKEITKERAEKIKIRTSLKRF